MYVAANPKNNAHIRTTTLERNITVFMNSEHIVVPLQLFMYMYSLTECDNTGITVVYIYNSRILLLLHATM